MADLPKMIQITTKTIVLLVNAPEEYVNTVRRATQHVDTEAERKDDTTYDLFKSFMSSLVN